MCQVILPLSPVTFSGVPVSEAYPHFGDPFELAYWCGAELAAWREALSTHKRISGIDNRMRYRPTLEAAYRVLKVAYEAAVNQDRRAAA